VLTEVSPYIPKIGVGGILRAGEKNVIVSDSVVKKTKKDDKWWLAVNETKDV
jgi:hypothetical protein